MSNCKQAIIVVLSLLLLQSCVSGPQYKPIEESDLFSTLYFYRLPKFGGGGIQPVIRINGDKVFKILSGSYSYARLAPGKHELALHKASALWPESKEPYYKVNVVVEGNSVSYFRWEAVLKGFYGTAFAFGEGEGFVPEAIGSDEIKVTKLITPETGDEILQPKKN